MALDGEAAVFYPVCLQVVGTSAYGVDFHALEDDAEERRPAQDRQPEVRDGKQGGGDACASLR